MSDISRYLNIRQAHTPAIGADGEYIAFLSNITGHDEVWRVPAGSPQPPWPQQLTFAGDRVLTLTTVPARPHLLIYGSDVGGNENVQLFLLNVDSGEEVALTAGYPDAMHLFLGWDPGGEAAFVGANRENPGRYDLYRLGLDGQSERIWINDRAGYLWQAAAAPSGATLVVTRTRSSYAHDLLLVDLTNGTVRNLDPSGADVRYAHPQFAPDGTLYVSTDRESDQRHVRRFDLSRAASSPVVASEWGVEALRLSPDGERLAYVLNEGGVGRLMVRELESGKEQAAPVPDTAPGMVGALDMRLNWFPDGRRLAFSFSSATRTSDVFVWDTARNVARAVTRSSHGGLPAEAFVSPHLITYETFDGREIPGWYYRPVNATAAFPVVVIVHGGPEGQSRPSFNFLVQYLVAGGYAVFLPNVRGSSGYGKAYGALDNVEKRMDSVADLAHAVHWLRTRPEVDGDRIAVYGGSYGGFMVLAALTNYPSLWAAGVDIVGISNFVTFLENTSAYRRAHREAEYGSLERDRAFMESIAPIHQLDKIEAPLLVIHGANDPRVPVSEAQQLVGALEARKHPVEFILFEDEGHGIAKLHNKRTAYPAIVAFLDGHLK